MKYISIIIVVIVLTILAFFKFQGERASSEADFTKIRIGNTVLNVEMAKTPSERMNGLSGRSVLPKDGMLFVFERPGLYSFWMKDMNFPIDIVWLSADMEVVYIKEGALPVSYPENFTPTKDSQYVLEVSSSFVSKQQVKIGHKAEIF